MTVTNNNFSPNAFYYNCGHKLRRQELKSLLNYGWYKNDQINKKNQEKSISYEKDFKTYSFGQKPIICSNALYYNNNKFKLTEYEKLLTDIRKCKTTYNKDIKSKELIRDLAVIMTPEGNLKNIIKLKLPNVKCRGQDIENFRTIKFSTILYNSKTQINQ